MGLNYVAAKTTYNPWFWIICTIFGMGFLVGVSILVYDFFMLGRDRLIKTGNPRQEQVYKMLRGRRKRCPLLS